MKAAKVDNTGYWPNIAFISEQYITTDMKDDYTYAYGDWFDEWPVSIHPQDLIHFYDAT